MQSRWNVLEIFTETLHHSDRITRHGIVGRPRAQADQSEDGNNEDPTRAATRQ
jgi:hypothetical protein